MAKSNDLNAVTLKDALWETLKGVRDGSMDSAQADSVAAQGREILRTCRTQLQILRQANQAVSAELVTFAAPPE